MRSTLAIVLTISLLGTGSLVAVDLATVLRSGSGLVAPHLADATGPDHTSVVRGFYDAANAMLAGEDALALTAVVAPRVEMHSGREAPTIGLDALAERLVALRRQGGLRLSVVEMVGGGEDVTALVEAHDAESSASLHPGDTAAPLWRTIDRFHLEGGMIGGYWPGAIESRRLPPLPAVTVPVPMEQTAISVARLELGGDVTLRAFVTPFPQVLYVENGTLLVSHREALAVALAGDSRLTWTADASDAEDMLLGPGDALLVPEGTGQAITNREDRPASVLSLLVAPRAILYGPKHDLTQDMLTVIAMHDPARVGRRTSWATGVTAETLAVGEVPEVTRTSGRIELRGDHLALEPGAHARSMTPAALTFTIVQSGTFSVHIQDSSGASATVASPAPDPTTEAPGNRLLRAGDALAIEHGSALSIENAGASRLDMMLVAVDVLEDSASPVSD